MSATTVNPAVVRGVTAIAGEIKQPAAVVVAGGDVS